MKKEKTLSGLLRSLAKAPKAIHGKELLEEQAKKLQLKMLRIQQTQSQAQTQSHSLCSPMTRSLQLQTFLMTSPQRQESKSTLHSAEMRANS